MVSRVFNEHLPLQQGDCYTIPEMPQNHATISVVIPAYNEAEHIGALLQSLGQQTTQRAFEVIVVDNASTDDTAAAAEQYANQLTLKIITEPRRSRGAARAAGFAAATGDIILSTDADTTVPPNWIEHLASALEHSPAVAVSGTCQILDCSPRINRSFNWLQPQLMRLYRLVYRHYWLTGSNCAIRRAAYHQAGGFRADAADMDDIDLGFRLRRIGRIDMTTSVPVTTSGRRFQHGLVRGLWPYVSVFFRRFFLRQTAARRD